MDSKTPIVGKPQLRLTAGTWIAVFAVMLLASGCGQKGGLYLPTDPAARDRATLLQVLSPVRATDSVPQPAPLSSAVPAALPASAASAAR